MPETTNEGQALQEERKALVFKNPFCGSPDKVKHPLLDNRKAWRITSATVDKKTLTTSPVFEEYDLQEEVQKCKELCGVEYMKMLLKTGQAKPEDFYDDGNSGFDMNQIPENVHEAKKKSEELKQDIANAAKAAGAVEGENYSAKQLEDLITAEVKRRFDAIQAQANKSEGESK